MEGDDDDYNIDDNDDVDDDIDDNDDVDIDDNDDVGDDNWIITIAMMMMILLTMF